MHHSSTSAYLPNFIEIEETFCGRTDVRTFETHFIRSTRGIRPKKQWGNNTEAPIALRPKTPCITWGPQPQRGTIPYVPPPVIRALDMTACDLEPSLVTLTAEIKSHVRF